MELASMFNMEKRSLFLAVPALEKALFSALSSAWKSPCRVKSGLREKTSPRFLRPSSTKFARKLACPSKGEPCLAPCPSAKMWRCPSAGLDPIIAAGIDQLILELKQAFRMTIVVVTHELASAYLIADRMVLIDKGNIVAIGTKEEMRASTQPRVRQFLDRVAEPEVA